MSASGQKMEVTAVRRDFCFAPDSVAKVESYSGPKFLAKT
jgi:hypothetical protein